MAELSINPQDSQRRWYLANKSSSLDHIAPSASARVSYGMQQGPRQALYDLAWAKLDPMFSYTQTMQTFASVMVLASSRSMGHKSRSVGKSNQSICSVSRRFHFNGIVNTRAVLHAILQNEIKLTCDVYADVS